MNATNAEKRGLKMGYSKEQKSYIRSEIESRCNIFSVARDLGLSIGPDNKINCPIKPEKTPSFQLYNDNKYFCFGCKASGNSIGLVMSVCHLSYEEALTYFCNQYGIIPPDDNDESFGTYITHMAKRLDSELVDEPRTKEDFDYRFKELMTDFQDKFDFIYKNSESSISKIQELHEQCIEALDYHSNKTGKTIPEYSNDFKNIKNKLDQLYEIVNNLITDYNSEYRKMLSCQDCFAGARCPSSNRNNFSGSVFSNIVCIGDEETDLDIIAKEMNIKASEILLLPAYVCQTLPNYPHVNTSDFLQCFSKYGSKMLKISKPSIIVIDSRYSYLKQAIINGADKEIKIMECSRQMIC